MSENKETESLLPADGSNPFARFEGASNHRCKCFGEQDNPRGEWRACPPDLCEADVLLERLMRAEQELAYTHDRGDHLVYRHEWEAFDQWQRWADDQRKDAERYQPTAQEFNDAMEQS